MDSRSFFNDTWLFETPMGIPKGETYSILSFNIKDFLKRGFKSEKISEDLNKLDVQELIYYWYGTDINIKLGVELHKKPEGLVESIVGKDPKLKGKSPWASDLYSAILKDAGENIRLISDTMLSDEGYSNWKKLFYQGHKISIYKAENPGQSITSFDSIEEMDNFFKHDDISFKNYQYVLSENDMKLAYVRALFNTRRYREIAGIL
jgi:hypothetical protein